MIKRTIAMNTDHDYYGLPTEMTRVELAIDPIVPQHLHSLLYRQQEETLRYCAKRMPHRYWHQRHGETIENEQRHEP